MEHPRWAHGGTLGVAQLAVLRAGWPEGGGARCPFSSCPPRAARVCKAQLGRLATAAFDVKLEGESASYTSNALLPGNLGLQVLELSSRPATPHAPPWGKPANRRAWP